MKVIVTGGAGFIGSHIVDLLIEEGHSVVVVDNLITGKRSNVNPKAIFYELDILDAKLDKVMEIEAPEIVIHQAALVYVQQSIQKPIADGMVNVMGTLNILHSAKRHKVRKIIYASTCAAYGEPKERIIKEDHSVLPISFYGASKYMSEIYLRLYFELFELDYTILRYANVYGPRQQFHSEGGVIPIFIDKMIKGVAPIIFGNGKQTRDFIYVKDVAKANYLAINQGSQQTFNIGTGIETSVNEIYESLKGILQAKLQAEYQPERKGDAKHCSLDPSKAKKGLKWEPTYKLPEGLKETVKASGVVQN